METPEKKATESKKTRTVTSRVKKTVISDQNESKTIAPAWSKKWVPTLLIISVALNIFLLATNTGGSESKEHNTSTARDPKVMTLTDMGQMLYGKEGDDLNKSFLESMIPHHEVAIEMAQSLERSNKPELVNLGRNIVTIQTAEIEQMRKWLREWNYEDADIPPTQPTQELY